MSYAFHPEAELEFLEAIDYYEERELNLGFQFAVEIYTAIDRAVEHPKTWRSFPTGSSIALNQKIETGERGKSRESGGLKFLFWVQ